MSLDLAGMRAARRMIDDGQILPPRYSPKELRIRIEIFYVGIVQDTFLSKDTFHSFLYGKACVFMDKMGEHTATPERAIAL